MAIYLDDKRLIKQLLDGDSPAFDRFFNENFSRLYRFAIARMPNDPHAARDVVQVTLPRRCEICIPIELNQRCLPGCAQFVVMS